jgi:hypothetical protein
MKLWGNQIGDEGVEYLAAAMGANSVRGPFLMHFENLTMKTVIDPHGTASF